jgi:hypothetical protein
VHQKVDRASIRLQQMTQRTAGAAAIIVPDAVEIRAMDKEPVLLHRAVVKEPAVPQVADEAEAGQERVVVQVVLQQRAALTQAVLP